MNMTIIKVVLFSFIISLSLSAKAAFITLDDISSIQLDLNGWSISSGSANGLFDGIYEAGVGGTRPSAPNFIRLRDGKDATVTLTVTLNDLFNISHIGISNDWGGILSQSVDSLSFFIGGNNILTPTVNSIFETQLFNLNQINYDVSSFSFTFSGINANEIEIRELLVGYLDESSVGFSVDAPGTSSVLILSLVLLSLRAKTKLSTKKTYSKYESTLNC